MQETSGEHDAFVERAVHEVGEFVLVGEVELLEREFEGVLHLVHEAMLLFEGVLDGVVQDRHGEAGEWFGDDENLLDERGSTLVEFFDVRFEQRQLVLLQLAVVDVQPLGLVGLDQVQDGGLDTRLVGLLHLAE